MNILYFHTHDLGRVCQPYGYAVETPHLQRFAEQGVLFRQAYCGGPTCSPSRASLLTGQYPFQCGMFGLTDQGWRLHDYDRHLAAFLGRHGYETAIFGSHHVTGHDADGYRQQPYQHLGNLDPQTNRADRNTTTDAAIAYLREPRDRPFFLAVGYDFTHQHRWLNALENSRDLWGDVDHRYVRSLGVHPDVPEVRRDTALFGRSVRYLDSLFGRVLRALDQAGLAEQTLVLFTTDHGPGLPLCKKNLLEGGSGVAWMMRGPGGFGGGQVLESLVHHVDLYPTLCDLLGLERPAWIEGESLLPLVRGERRQIRDAVLLQQNYHGNFAPLRGLRSERYKYLRRIGPPLPLRDYVADEGRTVAWLAAHGWGDEALPGEQLYDLHTEPNEAANLVANPAHARALAWHRRRLDELMRQTHDPALTNAIPAPPSA